MTTVQCIEDSLQNMADEEDNLRYEVKFQNKAIESLFNSKELGKKLHSPSLLIGEKLVTLHEATKKQLVNLSSLDVRILDREDHVHLRREQLQNETLLIEEQTLRPEKWVSIRRQEIIFDEAKCLLVSMYDQSERHKISKQQK